MEHNANESEIYLKYIFLTQNPEIGVLIVQIPANFKIELDWRKEKVTKFLLRKMIVSEINLKNRNCSQNSNFGVFLFLLSFQAQH